MEGLGGAAFQLPGTLDTPAPPRQIWSKQVICSRVNSFFFFQLLPRLWFLFLFSFLAGSLLSSSFLHGLSLVTVNRGASLVAVQGLLTAVASFVAEHGLSCLMATKVARGPEVWDLSSRTRDRTHVPCVGSCTSNHRATREVPPESIPSTQRVWVAALVIS